MSLILANGFFMRILHVAESALGGCGTYINELVSLQMDEIGVGSIRVVAPRQHTGPLAAIPKTAMLTFHRPSRKLGLLYFGFATASAIWNFRPDVIHAHSTFAGIAVRLLSRLSRHRQVIIYCPHGWASEVATSSFARWAIAATERLLSRFCDAIIAISHAEWRQGEALGIASDKLVLLHNGVSSRSPSGELAHWPRNGRRVLFVGRLDRQKGVDVLLAAIQGVEDRISLKIIGEAVVADSAQQFTPPASVEYLGWKSQEDVARYMNACDLLVVPSRWEGFGLVAIEAMRAGKPVIASAVGGLTEIITDGVTGTLFPSENAGALRDALLAGTDEELRNMGQAGREKFECCFTSDRVHRFLFALYAHHLSMRPALLKPADAVASTR